MFSVGDIGKVISLPNHRDIGVIDDIVMTHVENVDRCDLVLRVLLVVPLSYDTAYQKLTGQLRKSIIG